MIAYKEYTSFIHSIPYCGRMTKRIYVMVFVSIVWLWLMRAHKHSHNGNRLNEMTHHQSVAVESSLFTVSVLKRKLIAIGRIVGGGSIYVEFSA